MLPNSSTGLTAAKLQRGEVKTHRIRALTKVDDSGSDTFIWLGLSKAELDQSRFGTGQRRSVGFSLDAEVDIPGEGKFQFSSSWVAVRAR